MCLFNKNAIMPPAGLSVKCMMDTWSLTFPEEWKFAGVHVHLPDQADVGHAVGRHGLGSMHNTRMLKLKLLNLAQDPERNSKKINILVCKSQIIISLDAHP